MKDLSLFLLRNFLGSTMRKGARNFCNGDASTSTLNQQHISAINVEPTAQPNPPTLEEMILQLELEEEIARKAKINDRAGRMSCVTSSDILRSARSALNQYPRFSFDGKDAMYRSSFRNLNSRRSTLGLPEMVGGESVVWCKPGVVARLMGLEAMPVPVSSHRKREKLKSSMRRQNLRRRAERQEMERRVALMKSKESVRVGSCSSSAAAPCAMKPIVAYGDGEGGWPTRRFKL